MRAPNFPGVWVGPRRPARREFAMPTLHVHKHVYEVRLVVREGQLIWLHVCTTGHDKPYAIPFDIDRLTPAEEVLIAAGRSK